MYEPLVMVLLSMVSVSNRADGHVEDGEGRRGGSAVARERTVLDGERLVGRSGDVEKSAVAGAGGFKSQTIENDVLRPIESRREVGGDRR